MARSRGFSQVDVFSDVPLLGNPVAVILDRDGLTTAEMQRFTDWTNLSEATFVGSPKSATADYSVRIFAQGVELPFAGHPTLGSCFAWLQAGGQPKAEVIVQECAIGEVPIRIDASTATLSFLAPERKRSGPLDSGDLDRIMDALRLSRSEVADHQWCDNGPPWQVIMLRSANAVLALEPDPSALAGMFVGVIGEHEAGARARYEVRAFFDSGHGMREDPTTGSLNAAIGQWFAESGRVSADYVASQGARLGRAGIVKVSYSGRETWIGGSCVSVLNGTASI